MKKMLYYLIFGITCLSMTMVSCAEEPDGPEDGGTTETPTNPQEPGKPANPENPVEPVLPKDSTTVYFVNAPAWDAVNAYVWLYDTDEAPIPWPGKPATKCSEKVHDMDVYSYKWQTDQADMIIFHNGIGEQTQILSVDSTKPYYYNEVWYASLSEIPAPTPEPEMYNGYEYIDMGSGTLWAAHNVGANSITEVGNYYAWAETTPKDEYTWDTYLYSAHKNGGPDELTKYCFSPEYGYNGFVDYLTTIDNNNTTALNWDGKWSFPTKADFDLLLENSIVTVDHDSLGTEGVKFTSKVNGNKLFFPYTGYIDGTYKYDANRRVAVWAGHLAGDGFAIEDQRPSSAVYLHVMINQGEVTKGTYLFARCIGLPIRLVVYKNQIE